MTVQELFEGVRYQINDVDKVEYSDEELISYLNEAISFLNNLLIDNLSPLLIKTDELFLVQGSSSLPEDFYLEKAVLDNQGNLLRSVSVGAPLTKDSYYIAGREIFSGNSRITLYYYSVYPQISALTDTIQVHPVFLNLLKQMVIFLALNRNEFNLSIEQALMERFAQQALSLSNKIGAANIERQMPFVI